MTLAVNVKSTTADRPAWPRRMYDNALHAVSMLLRPVRIRTRPLWRAYERLAIGLVFAVVVLGGVMVFGDAPAIQAAKTLPRWFVDIFEDITDFGRSGWFLIPLGLALAAISVLACTALPRFAQAVLAMLAVRLGFVFMAIALPSLCATIVKRLIGRARPYVGDHLDPFLYSPLVWRSDYASLPSGHATTAFAALVAIGAVWPRLRAIMWFYAAIIAISRVVVLAHHPSDVVAGAILGAAGALLARDWFAARRLGFVIEADGRVRALPGPSWRRITKVLRLVIRAA